MSELPYLSDRSEIDGNGQEYIGATIAEPMINARDLYDGGKVLHFEINHRKQKTECMLFHYQNGAPRFENKPIKVWKDEVLGEQECLQFAREYMEGQHK